MVTMNKPAQGNTDWYQSVTDNWTSLEKQVIAFQGRLQRDSTTQVSLQRYGGDTVDVNGESVSLGSGGIALATSDNLITSTGADAGAAMGASTLYYVYVSNSSASSFPTDLRASTTAPSSYNGLKYLGTSGNAANWRFVGYVRTNGSTEFVDSASQRFVINYYNRRMLHLNATDSTDSWTYTNATWRQARGSTSNGVEFISNGEDTVLAFVTCTAENTGSSIFAVGIGVNSTTGDSSLIRGNYGSSGSIVGNPFALYAGVPAQGYVALNWLESSVAANTTTWRGDNGAPQYIASGITALVWG